MESLLVVFLVLKITTDGLLILKLVKLDMFDIYEKCPKKRYSLVEPLS